MPEKKSLTPEQCRGARAMLGWTRERLADESRVSPATLADFEAGKRVPYERTIADIRIALEEGGCDFIDSNGTGPGIVLRKSDDAGNGASKPRKKAGAVPPKVKKRLEPVALQA